MNEFLFLLILGVLFTVKRGVRFKIIFAVISFFLILYLRKLEIATYFSWLALYLSLSLIDFINRGIVKEEFQSLSSEHKSMELQFAKSEDKLSEMDEVNKQLQLDVAKITGFFEISKELTRVMYLQQLPPVIANIVKGSFNFNFLALLVFEGEKSYSVFIHPKRNSYELKENINYRDILDFEKILIEEEPGFYDGEELNPLFAKLGQSNLSNKMYLIPIILEGKVKGILAFEDLAEEKIDLAHTLSGFLSLTLRKLKLYSEVQELAITDELTQVFVRRHFQDVCWEELDRIKEKKGDACFLMLDLDRFKNCNDTFGHLVGDVVLRETAKIVQQNVREIDIVGRYGGEEFCIFLPDTSLDNGIEVSERIRKAVEKYVFHAYDEVLNITVSIGLSSLIEDAKNYIELVEKADMALYYAKRKGRNRAIAYSSIK
ncbi:MAG: GGDEF domain-containing protein [Candidatus Kaelpia aquatica]|nr:GGDEF domain-containing protein [Candidatus Kaelpia aquatica]